MFTGHGNNYVSQKDPVKVLYTCSSVFKRLRMTSYVCDILSKLFDRGKVDFNDHSLLLYQVVSLGFFLSWSYKKWKKLNCCIGDHGINLLHRYLCRDKTNKQEIITISLRNNHLTGVSSPFIGDVITNLIINVYICRVVDQEYLIWWPVWRSLNIGGNKLGDDGKW